MSHELTRKEEEKIKAESVQEPCPRKGGRDELRGKGIMEGSRYWKKGSIGWL
jgi:hypothetical protein